MLDFGQFSCIFSAFLATTFRVIKSSSSCFPFAPSIYYFHLFYQLTTRCTVDVAFQTILLHSSYFYDFEISPQHSHKTIATRFDHRWIISKQKRSERKATSIPLARQMWQVRPFLLNCRARPPPVAPPFFRVPPPAYRRAPPSPTKLAISSSLSSLAVVYVYATIPTTFSVFATSEPGICPTPTILLVLSFHVAVACPERSRARASTNSFAEEEERGRRRLTSDRGSDTVHSRRKTPSSRWKRDHCQDVCGFVIAPTMPLCSCGLGGPCFRCSAGSFPMNSRSQNRIQLHRCSLPFDNKIRMNIDRRE